MRLFLNPEHKAYLRELAGEFNSSVSHVRGELQQLTDAGLLNAERSGRQINYAANERHPLFPELQSMVRKSLGMDRILESIVDRLGDLEEAYIVGDYAEGRDTGIIDLVLVGEIDRINLADITQKSERYIGRKIRTLVLKPDERSNYLQQFRKQPRLHLWKRSHETQWTAKP